VWRALELQSYDGKAAQALPLFSGSFSAAKGRESGPQ
jgi:hypothetical protein